MKNLAGETNKIEFKKYKTQNGLNIYYIKTDKFKTNSINLFIHNQLDHSTVTQNALLPMVLRRGSKDYPTMQDISKKLEDLYGSSFNFGVAKKGERQILHFYIDSINDKYLQSNDHLFDECIKVLNSVITNPFTENGNFKNEYVGQEKENLSNLIQGRINDKVQYAVERCYELMCAEERFGIYELGTVEDLQKIDGANLFGRYKDVVNNSEIDIMVLGDIDNEQLERLGENINLNPKSSNEIDEENIKKEVKEPKTFIEDMNVNQGKLSLGFRTNINATAPDYYALMICNSVLGGGVHSKLFQNVREKASLAYYAFARLEKFKGLMMISSGIEADNYDKTKEIILKQIGEIKKGKITEIEFQSSIKTLENAYRAMGDEAIQMTDFFLGQSILGLNDSFDTIIKKIKNVKVEDVVKVAQNIELDTIHFIKPKA